MNDQPDNNIDGGQLARAPMAELRAMVEETTPGSRLRTDVLNVFRTVAFIMLSGEVPHGMTPNGSARRSLEFLQLAQEYSK